jgi:hypothetical protein
MGKKNDSAAVDDPRRCRRISPQTNLDDDFPIQDYVHRPARVELWHLASLRQGGVHHQTKLRFMRVRFVRAQKALSSSSVSPPLATSGSVAEKRCKIALIHRMGINPWHHSMFRQPGTQSKTPL